MALTERNRNVLYQGLTRTIGDEEAVEAMLSQFPAGDGDKLATESFVRTEIAQLETRMGDRFSDMKDYMHREMRRWYLWSYGAMFVLLAAVVTAAKILE